MPDVCAAGAAKKRSAGRLDAQRRGQVVRADVERRDAQLPLALPPLAELLDSVAERAARRAPRSVDEETSTSAFDRNTSASNDAPTTTVTAPRLSSGGAAERSVGLRSPATTELAHAVTSSACPTRPSKT